MRHLNLSQVSSAEPDQTSRFAASDLVQHCLQISIEMETRLFGVIKFLDKTNAQKMAHSLSTAFQKFFSLPYLITSPLITVNSVLAAATFVVC